MSNPLKSGDNVRDYTILELVGEGGFGRVYRAEHNTLGRIVALKELVEDRIARADLPAAIEDFRREAMFLWRLSESETIRKFIPQVYEYFEHNDRRFMAMEFVEGKTLEEILTESNGPVPWRTVVGWAVQVCEALEFFHSQDPPLVLRDIKPSNLMLCTKDGRIRIIDFGIAKQLRPDVSMSTRWLGSPGYAAPEQMIGCPTQLSDIYSLGATMYRLVTGNQPLDNSGSPYNRPSAAEATESLGSEAVSAGLSDLISKCLELHPPSRHSSVRKLRSVLEQELGKTGDFRSKAHDAPTIETSAKAENDEPPLNSVSQSQPVSNKGASLTTNWKWGWSALIVVILAVLVCSWALFKGKASTDTPQKKPVVKTTTRSTESKPKSENKHNTPEHVQGDDTNQVENKPEPVKPNAVKVKQPVSRTPSSQEHVRSNETSNVVNKPEPKKPAAGKVSRQEPDLPTPSEVSLTALPPDSDELPIYCGNCGTKVGSSDVYCGNCGAKIK